MLRFVGSRCVRPALVFNYEMRVVNHSFAQNLTVWRQVSKPLLCPQHSRMSTVPQPTSDDNLEVIYKGRMERDVIRVKLFSITTSVMGLVFQPILYSQVSSLPALIATCSVAGFFTFVTPVLLHQLAKRYVNRITYNKEKDNYIAETTTFFFRQKQITIQPGEAKIPSHGGMFTSVEVRGIPLMIEMNGCDKQHLVRLLGFDKPLNIEHERLAAYSRPENENRQADDAKVDHSIDQKEDGELKRSSNRL